MLLKRNDVNPNIADRNGETPFLIAAREGHEGIVKMLLEHDHVNPDTVKNKPQHDVNAKIILP